MRISSQRRKAKEGKGERLDTEKFGMRVHRPTGLGTKLLGRTILCNVRRGCPMLKAALMAAQRSPVLASTCKNTFFGRSQQHEGSRITCAHFTIFCHCFCLAALVSLLCLPLHRQRWRRLVTTRAQAVHILRVKRNDLWSKTTNLLQQNKLFGAQFQT